MKTHLQIKILLSALILFFGVGKPLMAQTNWVKHEGNPILTGQADSWYEDIAVAVVIHEENTFKMWFSASEQAWSASKGHSIGYAESDDGLEWEVREDPVIPVGPDGSWYRSKWPGTVLRINDTLKMWYGASADAFNYHFSMGYAWSVDEHFWNIDTVPLLGPGEPGSWDDSGNHHPKVHFDGTTYHMWFNGFTGGAFGPDQIGYATSTDGIHWEKDTLHNPVFPIQPSTFYSTWVWTGSVLVQDGEYQMWFRAYDGQLIRFGYATSTDGINWEPGNDNQPVLTSGPELWENWDIFFPSVLWHDGQYKMWYTGQCYGCDFKLGYATSDSSGVFIENYLTREFKYEVSPNPFTTSATLSYTLERPENIRFTVYNVQSQIVFEMQEMQGKGEQQLQWNAKGLPAGMYYFRMQAGEMAGSGKMIKLE